MLNALKPVVSLRDVIWQRGPDFRFAVEALSVTAGARLALIGGNGSGKSSALELMAGIARPDSGEIAVFGQPAGDLALRRRIGAQTPLASYNSVLKVGDIVALHRRLHPHIDPAVLAAFDVAELADRLTGALSQGQRRRLDLHLAFAHAPQLILLDEPTAGLDAARHAAFMRLCASAIARGATIVSATHDPAEVAAADRLLWFKAGRIRSSDTPHALLESIVGKFRGSLTYADVVTAQTTYAALPQATGNARIHHDGVHLEVLGDHAAEAAFDRLAQTTSPIRASKGAALFDDLLVAISDRSQG
jgi:ABC-2 type transport system ATP-binding protein